MGYCKKHDAYYVETHGTCTACYVESMTPPCPSCAAKDEEIARLWSLVAQVSAPVSRETVAVSAPEPSAPDPDPLPKVVADALAKKYEVNSRDWRSESRAARMLLKDGHDPEAIAVLVAKGQSTDRW